ncbi:MAG: SDR family NAD(P)-dependent oxidoreductase [Ornithinimicrobium sp.]
MKTAIITGGTRGIGAHLTHALADAGWFVVVLGRSAEGVESVRLELAAAGRPHLALACDVSDAEAVDDMVEAVRRSRPTIDLVVNNAGLIEDEVPIWEADVDQWWQVMVTNVRGPFLVTRAVAPIMIDHGGGRFININSGAATRADPLMSAYTASKSALARITGATAAAGAEHHLRAFDLAPGVIKTDMTQAMDAHVGRTEWTDPADVTALALAMAEGELDAFSGRMVRAGSDNLDILRAKAAQGLPDAARMIRLRPWGEDDPIA